MARPRKSSQDVPVKRRIESAFWNLIEKHAVDEITVNMIVTRAECSRGSFYYHFDDIDSLIDTIIQRNFPSLVPNALYKWFFASHETTPDMFEDPTLHKKLDRLCLLVGPNSSLDIITKVRQGFVSVWLKTFGAETTDLPLEARVLLEFMSNGVIGIISYRAHHGMDIGVERYIQAVFPDVPEAFMRRLSEAMGKEAYPLPIQ